MGKKPNTLLA